VIGLSLALVLGLAAPEAAVDAAPSEIAVRPIESVVLDGVRVDPALHDELELRAAGRIVVRSDVMTEPPAGRFVWLTVTWRSAERATLELIDTDGRAYERAIEAPADQLRRAIAGAAASMIAAIERGEITAARSGVEMPLPTPPPTTFPVAPSAAVVVHHTPPATRAAPAPPPPRWELGPSLGASAVIGLGPPLELDGFVGGGGGVGLDLRHRTGALVGVGARVVGHARTELAIVRIRLALSGGYALRRGAFELLARGGVSIEPIVLRDGGEVVRPLGPSGDATRAAPLVGVLAGIAPGVLLRGKGRAPLRLSLDVELAASMEARSRPGVAQWIDGSAAPATPLLRAGGLELALGLGVGGWFAID
jgi:hypothetical protein